MVEYTVAVCNYNMAGTVGTMVTSVLDQIDERFEVVVVDGGSTDGSQSVLRELAAEHDQLRVDLQDPDPNRHLGADRNRSFELADGEYVLESFDCDNRYYEIIPDLVTLFHQFESGLDRQFLLSAMGVNMAPRELVLDVPYRNLGGAEDRDWFRRLAARDAILWLRRTGPIDDQIGYHKSLRGRIGRDLAGKVCDFQTGISFSSAIRWTLSPDHVYVYEERRPLPKEILKRLYDLTTFPYAYLQARDREQYAAPEGFRRKGQLGREIAQNRKTARALADDLGIELDCSELSDVGRRAFCAETGSE
jgi:glycosyltransferase involved in cell wall biosynthesis